MKRVYQIGLLSTSLLIWAWLVKWYIILFVLLAELVYVINRQSHNKQKSKRLLLFFVILSIVLFALLREINVAGLYLPIGFSIFIYSAISLIIDGRKNGVMYCRLEIYNYLFFFAKAFAGPIDRAGKIIPQFDEPKLKDLSKVYEAFKLLIFAGFCKYVISDNLYLVDCDSAVGVNLFLSVIAYALAFYFDFYSYSLFAVGFAKLVGIELSMNFSSPYRSKSFKDFWTRWNITLTSWLRDYIYIPLGGSQKGKLRTSINVLIVFLISAIWHDCTIPFLIWGLCHASLLMIEKHSRISAIPGYRTFVFLAVCFLWQLFRIETIYDVNILFANLFISDTISYRLLITTSLGLLVMYMVENDTFKRLVFCKENDTKFIYKEVWVLAIMLVLTVLLPHNLNFNFFYLRF